jgi:CBS domain-containing protein
MPTCAQVMTKEPVCCLRGETVERAAQIMKDESVGPVPVVETYEDKTLIGIVTDRDIALRVVAEGRDPMTTTVETVMSRVLETCREEDDVNVAMELMADHQLRRIPIVNDGGQIVGIIAQADIATRLEEPETTAKVVEEISEK